MNEKLKRKIIIGGTFLVFTFLFMINYNNTSAHGDLQYMLNNAYSVYEGDVPYKDFWMQYGVGQAYLPLLVYNVFGYNVNNLLIFNILTNVLIIITVYLFIEEATGKKKLGFLMIFLMAFNSLIFWRNYELINIYFLFLIISLIYFTRFLKKGRKKDLYIAGLNVGISVLFNPFLAGAQGAAILFTLIYKDVREKNKDYKKYLNLGFFSVIPLILVIFLVPEIRNHLISGMFLDALKTGTSWNVPYFESTIRFFDTLTGSVSSDFIYLKFFFYLNISMNVILSTIDYIFPFLMAFVFLRMMKLKDMNKETRYAIVFLFVWFLISFIKSLGRSTMGQVSQSLTILMILAVFSLHILDKRDNVVKKYLTILLIVLAVIGALSFVGRESFDFGLDKHLVETKYAKLKFNNYIESLEANIIIKTIELNTEEGDYIHVIPPDTPPYYALTKRKNPTKHNTYYDVILRQNDAKDREICEDLANHRTKLIVYREDIVLDRERNISFNNNPIIKRCITEQYRLLFNFGRNGLYGLKGVNFKQPDIVNKVDPYGVVKII